MKTTTRTRISRFISGVGLTGCLYAITMPMTSSVQAGLPTTDPSNLYQAIVADIKRGMEWAQQEVLMQTGIDLEGLYAQMNVDTINNGFANMIARMSRGDQEVQNIEQMERSQPAQDACDTVMLAQGMNNSICEAIDSIFSSSNARAVANGISSGAGAPVPDGKGGYTLDPSRTATTTEIIEYNKSQASTTLSSCEDLGGDCENPSLLVAPPGPLDDKQYKAAVIQNEIAGGVFAKNSSLPPETSRTSAAFKKARLDDMRYTNLREALRVSRDNLLVLQQGTLDESGKRMPGQVNQLDQYMAERMGSENWLCEVTNSCTNGAKYVPPAELEKRKIQMQAVQLHIAMEQYKSSLRIERLMTDLTGLELDNAEGRTK